MSLKSFSRYAFTLVEMLVVIAIISILAAMAISQFSNAAQDSREIMARQQLAVVQEAASNWAAREVGKVEWTDATKKTAAAPVTVDQVRAKYNATKDVLTRVALFQGYLNEGTLEDLKSHATTTRLKTEAMSALGSYILLPDWDSGSYPKVKLEY